MLLLHQAQELPGLLGLLLLALGALGLRWRPLRLPAAVCLGLLWAAGSAHLALGHRLPPALEGQDLLLDAEIAAVQPVSATYTRLLLRQIHLQEQAALPWQPRALRVGWYGQAPDMTPGERWRLQVRLKQPNGLMNPAGFDFERWLFAQGIDAVGYVREPKQARLLSRGWSLNRLRDNIAQRLAAYLQGRPAQGVIVALAVGERRWIEPEQWEALRVTGTAHLVAISGLHVGLVALLAGFAVQRLWRLSATACHRWPARLPAVLAGILAASIYALLAGFTLPTQRALVMLLVPAIALLLRRRIRAWHGFGLALVAVLLWDPLAPLSAGFWLSFGAVGVLLAAGVDRLQGHWLRRMLKAQVVASFGLLPVSVLWLQTASWISPLANLIAIPLVGFLVVPLTLLGTAGLAIAPQAGVLLDAAEWLMAMTLHWLQWLAVHAPASEAIATPAWAVALAAVAAVLLVLPRGTGLRWLSLPLLLPLMLAAPAQTPSEEVLRLTLLDVGHGTAMVLEAGGEAAVYDAGPRRGNFDAGERILLPYLQSRGYRELSWLVVSHKDKDHSGGTGALVQHLALGEVWVGDQLAELGERPFCLAGEGLQWQGVELEFLWPPQPGRGGNEGSCVLRVQAAGVTVLLTGDIGTVSERALVQTMGATLAADVVLVPHHGSGRSSSEEFVAASTPKYALVSSDYRSRYGFPRPEVVQRYQAVGAQLLDTADEGAIQLRVLRDGSISLDSHRRRHGRYYHRQVEL